MGTFTHVAVFTFKPGTTEAQLEAARAALVELPSLIPEIRGYRFGSDAGLVPGNDDFAVVADFDDADGYRTYAVDPRHLDVIERLIRPITASRHAAQFTSD